MIELLMFSGGFDSTGLLFKLLSEERPNPLHIHHINFTDPLGRGARESKSVQAVIEYCLPRYDIAFSSSDHNYLSGTWLYDAPTVGFHAALVARDICQSRNTGELNVYIAEQKEDDHGALAVRRKTQQSIFNGYFHDWRAQGLSTPKLLYPCQEISKHDLAGYIPDELRGVLWSCRAPQKVGDEYIQCGNCEPCRALAGR